MKEGQQFKVDSYKVKQYENERFVDVVRVAETPTKGQRTVLCYSMKYLAHVLIPKSELKNPYIAQKIEIKVEQAFVGSKDLYFCLYVDDQFVSCPWMLSDLEKPSCKKWLKDTMQVKNVQDAIFFENEIKEGNYEVCKKTGLVWKAK